MEKRIVRKVYQNSFWFIESKGKDLTERRNDVCWIIECQDLKILTDDQVFLIKPYLGLEHIRRTTFAMYDRVIRKCRMPEGREVFAYYEAQRSLAIYSKYEPGRRNYRKANIEEIHYMYTHIINMHEKADGTPFSYKEIMDTFHYYKYVFTNSYEEYKNSLIKERHRQCLESLDKCLIKINNKN